MRLLPSMFTAQSAVPTFSGLTTVPPKQGLYPTLSGSQLSKARTEALAAELNTLYQSVMDSLGADDARYIQRVYTTVVYSEVLARGLLAVAGRMSSRRRIVATWLLGTSLLSFSKILNNMELGHNVMHGQYNLPIFYVIYSIL